MEILVVFAGGESEGSCKAKGSCLGHCEALIPGKTTNFNSIASKTLKAFSDILQLLSEIIGMLQELPGEPPCSL